MNAQFMKQLEDVEGENSGYLVLDQCPDESHNIHKRCKGKTSYHYPEILQVRGCLCFCCLISFY